MPQLVWTPPAFVPGVVWQDTPSRATPVDAVDLNLDESSEASYAASIGTSIVAKINADKPWLGLNGNHLPTSSFNGNQTQFSALGILYTRISQVQGQTLDGDGITTLMPDLATIASIGQIPVLILSAPNYDSSTYPTAGGDIASYAAWFVAQVQAIEAAHPLLGTLYEIDNEVWNFYSPAPTAAQYAAVVVAVLNAAVTAGLDLARIYPMIKDSAWLPAMYTAQPTLKTLVQGWSIHPYGPPPPGYAASTAQGIAAVADIRAGIFSGTPIASGANNILISEIGYLDASVSGSPSGALEAASSGAQAAAWLSDTLELASEYRDAGWLRAMLIYHRSAAGFAMVVVNTGGTLTAQGQALVQQGKRARGVPGASYSPRGAPGLWLPYDDNQVAASMPPESAVAGVSLVSNKIVFIRVRVDSYDFFSKMVFWLDTAGATFTANRQFAGVYQQQAASGANAWSLYDDTADQTTAWGTAAGTPGIRQAPSIGGDSFIPGYYYAAFLCVATTPPKFRGIATKADQVNLSGALPMRAMVSVASFTALPNNIDLSSGSVVSAFAGMILVGFQP